MTNLSSQNQQNQPFQDKSPKQSSGFELIIGSVLKEILTSGIRLILFGSVLLILSMFLGLLGHKKQQFKGTGEILPISGEIEMVMEEIPVPSKWLLNSASGFFFNVGIALIAAGSVVITVELRSNQEREKKHDKLLTTMDNKTEKILGAIEENTKEKINDLTIASQDTIISSLIQNKNIFNQVKNHILRQDFIVEKYLVKISLAWDHDLDRIIETTSIKYYACNISQNQKSYPINFYVYNNALNYHSTSRITKYHVNGYDYLSKDLHNKMETQRMEAQQYIGFYTEIDINCNSKAKIEIEFVAYREANDHEIFLVAQITDTMTLQINDIPQNIKVFCVNLHPLKDTQEELDKVWKINTGLFPYQGFYLCWQKDREININSASIAKKML
ncbi:MAG: hypothetical protein AAGA80_24570 [Cyanobacteria bacterium P01_F01_bin.143]